MCPVAELYQNGDGACQRAYVGCAPPALACILALACYSSVASGCVWYRVVVTPGDFIVWRAIVCTRGQVGCLSGEAGLGESCAWSKSGNGGSHATCRLTLGPASTIRYIRQRLHKLQASHTIRVHRDTESTSRPVLFLSLDRTHIHRPDSASSVQQSYLVQNASARGQLCPGWAQPEPRRPSLRFCTSTIIVETSFSVCHPWTMPAACCWRSQGHDRCAQGDRLLHVFLGLTVRHVCRLCSWSRSQGEPGMNARAQKG